MRFLKLHLSCTLLVGALLAQPGYILHATTKDPCFILQEILVESKILDQNMWFALRNRFDTTSLLPAPELITTLVRLSPTERKNLLQEIQSQTPARTNLYITTIKLALYSRTEWSRFIQTLTDEGLYYGVNLPNLVIILEHMPSEFKPTVYQQIRAVYPHLAKKYALRKRIGEKILDPKRAVDLLIRHMVQADSFFTKNPSSPRTEIRVNSQLSAYLAAMREIFHPTPFGDYSLADIKSVAQAISQELKKVEKSSGLTHATILLYGSFPNGKALVNSSDLDVVFSSAHLRKLIPLMDQAIANALRGKYDNVGLHLSEAPALFNAVFAAHLSPLYLRITAQNVDVLYYDQNNRSSRYRYLFPGWDPTPRIFPWF